MDESILLASAGGRLFVVDLRDEETDMLLIFQQDGCRMAGWDTVETGRKA